MTRRKKIAFIVLYIGIAVALMLTYFCLQDRYGRNYGSVCPKRQTCTRLLFAQKTNTVFTIIPSMSPIVFRDGVLS